MKLILPSKYIMNKQLLAYIFYFELKKNYYQDLHYLQ